MWERFVLFALRGQAYRCRDCRRRFWIGIEWGPVILGALTVVVVAGVVTAMVLVRRSQQAVAATPPPPRVRRQSSFPQLPRGLQPLSSVPAEKKSPPAAENPH
jgi:hypothetical protein